MSKDGAMRNIVGAFLLVIGIVVPSVLAELKIGYIDSKAILAKYQVLTDA